MLPVQLATLSATRAGTRGSESSCHLDSRRRCCRLLGSYRAHSLKVTAIAGHAHAYRSCCRFAFGPGSDRAAPVYTASRRSPICPAFLARSAATLAWWKNPEAGKSIRLGAGKVRHPLGGYRSAQIFSHTARHPAGRSLACNLPKGPCPPPPRIPGGRARNRPLKWESQLVAGDTLFGRGALGRHGDLWGRIVFSKSCVRLKGEIARLPDETVVYPGHGEATDDSRERNALHKCRSGRGN